MPFSATFCLTRLALFAKQLHPRTVSVFKPSWSIFVIFLLQFATFLACSQATSPTKILTKKWNKFAYLNFLLPEFKSFLEFIWAFLWSDFSAWWFDYFRWQCPKTKIMAHNLLTGKCLGSAEKLIKKEERLTENSYPCHQL